MGQGELCAAGAWDPLSLDQLSSALGSWDHPAAPVLTWDHPAAPALSWVHPAMSWVHPAGPALGFALLAEVLPSMQPGLEPGCGEERLDLSEELSVHFMIIVARRTKGPKYGKL